MGFEPLGKSTLLKVIAESCGASVRKCMQDLDNYLAEGTRAFDDLRVIVDKLSQAGLTNVTLHGKTGKKVIIIIIIIIIKTYLCRMTISVIKTAINIGPA